MYQKKLNEDIRCPLEYGLQILDGKWKSRILCELGNIGPMRFGEMKAHLVNITDGVLANTLNELAASGLLVKGSDCPEKNSTCYYLTDKGRSLIPLLRALCKWASSYYHETGNTVMEHCRQCSFHKEWVAERRQQEQ